MSLSFYKQYPLLDNLLGANFCDLDFEDKSYQDVILEYKSLCSDVELETLKDEFDKLFQIKNANHIHVRELSNVYLETDEEMYEWLHELYGYLFEDK